MTKKANKKSDPVYDKRDSRSWKAVKHGVSSPHPSLTRISLDEARALGMCDSGELIISPMLGLRKEGRFAGSLTDPVQP